MFVKRLLASSTGRADRAVLSPKVSAAAAAAAAADDDDDESAAAAAAYAHVDCSRQFRCQFRVFYLSSAFPKDRQNRLRRASESKVDPSSEVNVITKLPRYLHFSYVHRVGKV